MATSIGGAEADHAKRVLVVVSGDLRDDVAAQLAQNCFTVIQATRHDEVASLLAGVRVDCVIVDLSSSGQIPPLTLLQQLRSSSEAVIFVLADVHTEDAIVSALDEGADALLIAPFSTREIVARVRALLRRERTRHTGAERLRLARFDIDPRSRTVTAEGEEVALKPKEFDLLLFLAQHRDQVVTRQELLARVWRSNSLAHTRTVDAHIYSLRSKLERDRTNPRYLITVRGTGYCLKSSGE